MHDGTEDDGAFDEAESGGRHLPDALTRSWPASVFVLLAVGFTAWYVWFQPLQPGASGADMVIHVLQLVPSVCAILVPAAFLARHPDAPSRAGTLLAGTILFALVQGLVVLADPLQVLFETVTPPSTDLGGVVPLQAVYSALISTVAACALGFMALGLAQARRYEDRAPGWLTGWLVPTVTVIAGVVGVVAAGRAFGDLPMTPSLAIYLGATIVLSVVRVIVWAYLLAVTTRGAMAGEAPAGGWALAAVGAAAVLVSLVVLNVTGALDLPTADVANVVSYGIVVAYAAGNLLLLLAFVLGLPDLSDADDTWDDDAGRTVSRR